MVIKHKFIVSGQLINDAIVTDRMRINWPLDRELEEE